MRISEKHEHKNADTIEKILEFVRQNYWKDISLNQVAESVFMSVPYLCKVFKEYTGKTFNTYLTEARLDSTILLLENPSNRGEPKQQDYGCRHQMWVFQRAILHSRL